MKTESKPAAPAVPAGGTNKPAGPARPLIWAAIFLLAVLALVFHRVFVPGNVIFSNDAPLGLMTAEQFRMPSALKGNWVDLNWFGSESVSSPASISSLIRWLPPVGYAKFLCPSALFIVGMGACFCFRKLKLSPWACVLGGLAAALNSDFFSTSCWGVSSQVIGFGAMYAAVGFLSEPSAKRQWVRLALAGMAIGIGVMEAYDIGALFSLFIAAFVVYQALFMGEGLTGGHAVDKFGRGIGRLAVVVPFAILIATHTIAGLIDTQIKGIAGTAQDEQTKKARWGEATQWSVPKIESLQVIVPGMFGYRQIWHMYESDQPTDDQYWGVIGEGGGLWRLVGTGFYAGVLVVMIALWAMLQSFRGRGSPFTLMQRRAIWFWSGAMLLALFMAFGKNAPFYQFFYALPYASTIRNPQKFMHVFSWALVIVFTYGVHGLMTAYMQQPVTRVQGLLAQFKSWRAKADPFDRKWLIGCAIAIGVSLLGWLIYAAQSSRLESYIATVGIDPAAAPGIARFSLHAVGWFVLLLVLAVGLLALIFSGQFSGLRAMWGALLIAAFLIVDLGRAGSPWIVYWDINYKYASDPIIKFLAEKPYEHRMSVLPWGVQGSQQFALLHNAYGSAWKQQLFPYNEIECLEVIQEPRVPVDKETFMQPFYPPGGPNTVRLWELSNTRYLLGQKGAVDYLNTSQDPALKRFRLVKSFELRPKRPEPSMWPGDYSAAEDPKGELGLVEFTGALPRAKLFSNWQISTNDEKTLQTLTSPTFDPHLSVLVSDPIAPPNPATATQDPGTVELNPNYRSKRVEMSADVKVPAVLLLTDKYSPKWHVEVDGKPATLLRCNYIVRGVYLEPGKHTIVMRFVTSATTLWVSLGTIVLGLALWGFLALDRARDGKNLP